MDGFDIFVLRYFGVLGLGVAALNYFMMTARIKPYVRDNPHLAEEYRTLTIRIIGWMTIPTAVIAFGGIIGYPPSIEYYFRPRDGNIVVLLFHASVVYCWVTGTRWLFFRQGAETLAQHPGVMNTPTNNPTLIKFFWLLCLAGGITAFCMMWRFDIPPFAR